MTRADEGILQGICGFRAWESDTAFLLREFCELKRRIEVVGKEHFIL